MKKKFLMLLTVVLLSFPITKVYASYNQRATNIQLCMTQYGDVFGGVALEVNFNIDEGNYVSVDNMSYFFTAYQNGACCEFRNASKTSGSTTYASAKVDYTSLWDGNYDMAQIRIKCDEYGNTSNEYSLIYRGR